MSNFKAVSNIKIVKSEEAHGELSGDGFLLEPLLPVIESDEPGETTKESERKTQDPEEFSALELEDRVVISLIYNQIVRIEQVAEAWHRMRKHERAGEQPRLWRVLAEDLEEEREQIYAEAANVYKIKTSRVEKQEARDCLRDARELFTPEQWSRMQGLHLLPVHRQDSPEVWTFITYDPLSHEIHFLLKSLDLGHVELEYAPQHFTTSLIVEGDLLRNEYFERVQSASPVVDLGDDMGEPEFVENSLEAEIARSALVNLFEASLVEAVHKGASDIHIFPNDDGYVAIHFRLNGELETWYVEKHVRPEALLAVVKDRTLNVDRFERDSGQDGFIQRKIDETLIRFRVSVLPIAHTSRNTRFESIVIRVLDDRNVLSCLEELGLAEHDLEVFRDAIRQPTGIVILTGPTGSGKTTTLYAALQEIASPKRNVLTVEDPVEYVLPSVRQLRVSHKLGVGEALRFILRHDPDVVMVGEMRDKLTADLAVHVANTGHLTFSTLHTNDAPSAITRLYMLGVEPFLVANSINLIVAQRLIRILCSECSEESEEEPDILQRIGFSKEEIADTTFLQSGTDPDCGNCLGVGYSGRQAITEMLQITPEIRRIIATTDRFLDEDGIRVQAAKDGMVTLHTNAKAAVLRGETSVEEMMRVIGSSLI